MKKQAFESSILQSLVPLFGSRPQAGFPAFGDEHIETHLNIHEYLVTNPATTFFVRVEGDSMEGFGICAHDILVVDRAPAVAHNDIVVAAVSGELVVKRYHKGRDGEFLVSAGREYPPIFLRDQDECIVWGVVIGSVRRF